MFFLPSTIFNLIVGWSLASAYITDKTDFIQRYQNIYTRYVSPHVSTPFLDAYSISSTYSCESVSPLLPVSDFHCVSASGVWTVIECSQTTGCHK